MTDREAIDVFDGLRKAFRAFKPAEDVQALGALTSTHVLSSSLGGSFSSALATLRAVFDAIDNWESRNPSN